MFNAPKHPIRGGGAAGLIVLWLALFLATPASAANHYEDVKLDAFVEAVIKIASIKSAWLEQARNTTDKNQLGALNDHIRRLMTEAVESTPNMSVEEYNAIVDASKADKDLHRLIARKVQARAAELEKRLNTTQPPEKPPSPPMPNEPARQLPKPI